MTYKNLLKPILFLMDTELTHDLFTTAGELLGKSKITKALTKFFFSYENKKLERKIDGVEFSNPIGLAAGFDYDGHMSALMSDVGFGFSTVGTVTAKPYEGNTKPRLGRLPKSKALFVNKGFKSMGALEIEKLLDSKNLEGSTIGISVGSSNLPEINSIQKAIDDYIFTFNIFKDKDYVKYLELNISCPNLKVSESFVDEQNLTQLLEAVQKLNIEKPIYIKMPNETTIEETNALTDIAINYPFIKGYIFSNLVKKRENKGLHRCDMKKFSGLPGNFSGKPTTENALKLVKNARERYGNEITIIGCGGIFTADDAKEMLDAGADLIQLITGLIYEGPQVIGEINKGLVSYFSAR